MIKEFKHFIDQIPVEILEKTEKQATSDIVIFRPPSFVANIEMHLEDYHFVLPTSDPPPMQIERSEHHFRKRRLMAFTPETKLMCKEDIPTRRYIALNIKKDFFQEISKTAIGKTEVSFSRLNNPYSSILVNLIGNFELELQVYRGTNPLMLRSISTQIIIQLLRETGNDRGYLEKKMVGDQNYIHRAIEYMTTFYNANVKIEDICKEINLSPYYFMRIFKDKIGQSPHEFLMSVRVNKAQEMLKTGNYSIEEVASLCGYVSTAHFSSYFKRVKGISPSEYRKKYFIVE